MSDYTPTTEEVRKIYADYRDDIREVDPLGSYPLSGQEFDRWFAEVKAEAVIELVARIEAAVILLGDDDITPTGRRMISKVLNPYRKGEEHV